MLLSGISGSLSPQLRPPRALAEEGVLRERLTPYPARMDPGIVEVDMPKIVALKDDRLAGVTPRCRLARISSKFAPRGANYVAVFHDLHVM